MLCLSIQKKLVLLSAVIAVFAMLSAATSWYVKSEATRSLRTAGSEAVPQMLALKEAKSHFIALQTTVMKIALWSVMNGDTAEKTRYVQKFSESLAALDAAAATGLLPAESYQKYRGRIVNAMTLVQRNPRIGFAAVRGVQDSYEELAREIANASRVQTRLVLNVLDEAVTTSHFAKTTTAVAGLIVIAVAIWSGIFVGRSIGGPIVQIAHAMEDLAHGNLKASTGLKKRNDEVGVLLDAMEVFRASAKELYKQEQNARQLAADERRRSNQLAEANEQTNKAMRELESAKKEIEIVALKDGLTGLSNRLCLEAILRDEGGADQDLETSAVVAIDLDRFKEVNDTYGHEAGDAVLLETGRRLMRWINAERDHVFRIGGDEFVVILADQTGNADTGELCNDILFDLLQPIPHKGVNLTVGASIGFASRTKGETLTSTQHRADLALYKSKNEGRFRVTPFSESIGQAHIEKISLIKELRHALDDNQIEIHLQPKVRADDWSLIGCEALARWNNPSRGLIKPDILFSIADEARLTAEIDRRVFDLAKEMLVTLPEHGIHLQDISINISQQRLTHPDFIADVKRETLSGQSVVSFEVLETAFLDYSNENMVKSVEAIKSSGIDVYVDDFGTGHASLASVIGLRPCGVKIDKMFVEGIDRSAEKMKLMRSLIEIAHSVDAIPVVEGVETLGEAEALNALNAQVLQGYLFSRPLPPQDFIAWAKAWHGKSMLEQQKATM